MDAYEWRMRESPQVLNVDWEVLEDIESSLEKKTGGVRKTAFLWGSVCYCEKGDVFNFSQDNYVRIIEKQEVLKLLASGGLAEEIETRIAIHRISQ